MFCIHVQIHFIKTMVCGSMNHESVGSKQTTDNVTIVNINNSLILIVQYTHHLIFVDNNTQKWQKIETINCGTNN